MLRTSTAMGILMMVVPAVALAAGRPAEITCLNAGYRAGSVAFDMCVARMGGDDPLAALQGGELSAHADKADAKTGDPTDPLADPLAALAPVRTTVPTPVTVPAPARDEVPPSFNTPVTVAPPPPSPPPSPSGSAGPGWMWPTPPTAPTLPSMTTPTVPAWNFGGQ